MLNGNEILIALLLTLLAGMSTGLGALLSFFTKRNDKRVLSAALGLSAGVMVFISLFEMLPEAVNRMTPDFGERSAKCWSLLAFFGGVALIALIDKLVPEDENPHEMHELDELKQPDNHHMKRTGLMLALAIGIHNFPEGIATFVSALDGLNVALPIVVAIAIHNIPEGIAVSVPIYQSTGNRRKALLYTALTGLSEPIGALAALVFLMPFWTPMLHSILIAAVAGIMIYISFDELLPGSEQYGYHHIALAGVLIGMALMAVTLIFL